LDSGKKLDVQTCVQVGGHFFIRTGGRTLLIVSGAKVQSVETQYETKEELDEIFS
jgi:hypothetical protein